MNEDQRLWYRQAAKKWEEALPLGNGKLGAMVFGGPESDTIQLNEDSVWSDKFVNRDNLDAFKYRPGILKLLESGDVHQAELLAKYAMTGMGPTQAVYQTVGNFSIEMTHLSGSISDYQRELNIETAVAATTFVCDEVEYRREYLISVPKNSVLIHLTVSKPGQISFNCCLKRDWFWSALTPTTVPDDHEVVMSGGNGIKFDAVQKVQASGGVVRKIGEYLVVDGADEVTIAISIATSFRTDDPLVTAERDVNRALSMPFAEARAEHICDHQKLYQRLQLQISGTSKGQLPTDERLRQYQQNPDADFDLINLYYNYGRYLLVSCSRPGSLPANLQGVWNKDTNPHWGSKYTININTEMNYWPAESTNLSELHEPLFAHMERMYPHGQVTAQEMYHARGWMAHHNTDIWGDTAPQDLYTPATVWSLGALFLSTHIWQHYEYTDDLEFLKKHFYLLHDAVLFFNDYLIKNNAGKYVVAPSLSPENSYVHPKTGQIGHMVPGSTMDSEILHQLFTQYLKASELLNEQDWLSDKIATIVDELEPIKIHSNGTIREWAEEYEEVEPGHRHISHLYGLYPSDQISPFTTPELAAAAQKTINRRLQNGGGHTGWSLAWIINMRARLLDGANAYAGIKRLLSKSTQINLLDLHPPFQIDGNFGETAAVTEMLIQSVVGKVVLLPALPTEWANGKINGVKAKGNLTLDITWQEGQVIALTITAQREQIVDLVVNNQEIKVPLTVGENTITLAEK